MHRRKPLLWLLVSLSFYTIVYFVQVRDQTIVTNVDYWQHLERADALSLTRLETWVHGFYPVGYFALLKIGLAFGFDVLRFGQFLSWLGSIGCLVAVYLLLYAATKKISYALAAVALLSLHPFFRLQALQEGSDMLAAGLQLLALALPFLDQPDRPRQHLLTTAASGALLAGSYLVRYTSFTLIPVVLIYLWLREARDRRMTAYSLFTFAGAFTLVALPQLVASTMVTGEPFYNEQARNVWFGIYGGFNWTDNWQRIPPDITLLQIVQAEPREFLSHWVHEFTRFIAYDSATYTADPLALERKVTLWEPLLNHLVWLFGSLLLVFDNRLTRPQAALLLMALYVPIMITSMAWLFTRFLLVSLALQVVVIILTVSRLGSRLAGSTLSAERTSLALLSVYALSFWLGTTWRVKQERLQEMVRRVEEMQPILEAAGVGKPDELMTNNRLVQVIDDSRHAQYPIFFPPGDDYIAVPALLARITGSRQPSFLLFDWTSHAIRTYALRPYRSELIRAKDHLAPLHLTDEYALYCVVPCKANEATPVNLAATPALTLVGMRAISSRSSRADQHGLYLYWRLEETVEQSQRLSLTLRSEADGVVFHSVRDFQQGTYTLDEWPPGKLVVDYHLISSSEVVSGRVYYLTIALGARSTSELPSAHEAPTIPIRFTFP